MHGGGREEIVAVGEKDGAECCWSEVRLVGRESGGEEWGEIRERWSSIFQMHYSTCRLVHW